MDSTHLQPLGDQPEDADPNHPTSIGEHAAGDGPQRSEDARELRRGRLLGQFRVHYQAIIDVHDGTLAGMEALVRWQHPERGTLNAGSFVPTAERAGEIDNLDEEVLRAASVFRRDLRLPSGHQLRVTVNATAADLVRPGVIAGMRKTLAQTHLAPELLEVEVAGVLAANRAALRGALAELDAAGVRLAIDDFAALPNGTEILSDLPFHGVNVDFHDVGEGPDDWREIADRLAPARQRGLRVGAKRVETANHLRLLRALDVETAQGYALGRPVRAAEFHALLVGAGLVASAPAPEDSAQEESLAA